MKVARRRGKIDSPQQTASKDGNELPHLGVLNLRWATI
jgi:hypothetical protein